MRVWAWIGGIVLVSFLYWKPLHTYLHTKSELQSRVADVHALQAEKKQLQARIAAADSGEQLLREALEADRAREAEDGGRPYRGELRIGSGRIRTAVVHGMAHFHAGRKAVKDKASGLLRQALS